MKNLSTSLRNFEQLGPYFIVISSWPPDLKKFNSLSRAMSIIKVIPHSMWSQCKVECSLLCFNLFLAGHRAARIVAALQPGCEEMKREWGNEEEMERKWGNGERLTLYISSFSLYFLPLSPFPNSLSISSLSLSISSSKCVTFCCKMLTTAIWRECHKNLNIRGMRK